jgi:hypothetical protein
VGKFLDGKWANSFWMEEAEKERLKQAQILLKNATRPSQKVKQFLSLLRFIKKILTFMSLNKFQYEIWCMINLLIFFVQ